MKLITAQDLEELDTLDLRGRHTHLCPRCFRDVICEDDCSWFREMYSRSGVPACHPTVCDDCIAWIDGYEQHGSGI